MNKLFSSYLIAIGILLSLSNCENKKEEEAEIKQLNLSVLLDLSDRIDSSQHPFQVQVDTENIQMIISLFKKNMEAVGPFDAKGKMKFFFFPPPTNEDIIQVAKNLTVDFNKVDTSSLDGVNSRIKIFQNFDTLFTSNIRKLYHYSSQNKIFLGADIFSFFKDEIEDLCIENDPSYRNVLVIVTDGYLYWEPNKTTSKNRYTYIGPKAAHVDKFRKIDNWELLFDKEDYGFININKDLSNLEILVLGVNPIVEKDFDIIKKYWYKWFLEMKIKPENIKILKTELPVKGTIIEKFFNRPV